MKFSKSLLLETENHEAVFNEMPQIHFLTKLKRYFSLMEKVSKNGNFALSRTEKNTMHIATLPIAKRVL